MNVHKLGVFARIAAVGLGIWPAGAADTGPLLPTAETAVQRDARLAWWREARFGLFIHWGPSSLSGKEISWARIGYPHDHPGLESVPAEEYDQLYRRFNPVKFDADAWLRLAKEAGTKYVVFITKHHDGFSLWPTRLRPDYSIAATPFRRDICREIADAAHQLPPLKAKVLRATALTGGSVAVSQSAAGIALVLPPDQQDRLDTIIKLELDAPAAGEFRDGRPLDVPAPVVLRLDSPVDYQVFQRQTPGAGQVRVSGRAPEGTERLEVQVGGDWQPLEFRREDGAFHAELGVPAGGWYVCRARATGGGRLLATAEVPHVGVGEVFVVVGQSNSANHGEEKLSPQTGLVAAFDGTRWQPAQDPQPGASGEGGSFLPPFGDAIAERFKVPVGLVACGIGATSVREWLPPGTRFPNPPTLVGRVRQLPNGEWESKGEAFAMFTARLKPLGPRGFRAVLWHQGESDANQQDPTRTLPGNLYRQYLEQLIRDSRRELGWDAPWFVAQVSYHVPGDEASPEIRAAQKSLWGAGLALEGPDTDALKGELRERNGQGVHFSGEGLREHARRWVEKVVPWLEKQLAR